VSRINKDAKDQGKRQSSVERCRNVVGMKMKSICPLSRHEDFLNDYQNTRIRYDGVIIWLAKQSATRTSIISDIARKLGVNICLPKKRSNAATKRPLEIFRVGKSAERVRWYSHSSAQNAVKKNSANPMLSYQCWLHDDNNASKSADREIRKSANISRRRR
jgi:hypothetical protein